MIDKKVDKNWLILGLLVFLGFIIRLVPLDFPAFTSEEARIAYRGYLLTTGRDELGRQMPLFFNSQQDYQFPVVSYTTFLGERIFGKSEFGVKIPFIIIGTFIIPVVFKISKRFGLNQSTAFLSAFLIAFSPPLIFLSRIPNETIILTLLFTILFYLLIQRDLNILLIAPTLTLIVLTSKLAFFILLPYVCLVLFLQRGDSKSKKITVLIACSAVILAGMLLFLSNSQAKRSFLENNFPVISNLTISNGINTLRGEGLQSGWNPVLERALFNKLHFLTVGFLHWMSHFDLSIFFGQFDTWGIFNFKSLGAWSKALVIPLFIGIVSIVKERSKLSLIFVLFLILTFPALFSYPSINLELLTLTLPFMAVVIVTGFTRMNKLFSTLIIFFVIFEVMTTLFNTPLEIKKAADTRPDWAKSITADIENLSNESAVAISDNIIPDITPLIGWYTSINPTNLYPNKEAPYRFIQYDLGNIKIIRSDNNFNECSNEQYILFLGERDLDKLKRKLEVKVSKIYQDSNGKYAAYLILNKICIN